MILFKLARLSLANRKSSALLCLFTIAISVMLLLSIERIRIEAKASFSNTISGTDLIVGARSGATELLLASVFRIGHTTNMVSWQSYQEIKQQRGVKWTIPISLGDSHRGYAVLGTNLDYFTHYRYAKKQALHVEQGRLFAHPTEVVLGALAAKELGYELGQQIVVSHGAGNTSFHHHDAHPFTIVGILAATGTPVDKTVHIPLIAIDRIHDTSSTEHEHEHEHEHEQLTDLVGHPKQISAFLVGLNSPVFALQAQRNINQFKDEPLLAILPGFTLRQLWQMLSFVEKALWLISIAVVIISLLGMLTTLLSTLNQRRRELAILRSVGARPSHIFSLLSLESLLVTSAGVICGVLGFYLLIALCAPYLQSVAGISVSLSALSGYEVKLIASIIGAGLCVGFIPAVTAYRYSLADGMSIKL
ncbi:putative ABC transport system permease protein [Pseudoalteromonas ulvae UL12]|uniref:ABC transporter permease n=1 Tax=Pseudoalteromonas ulvae TaxID=107327 RepID=UPI00186B7001|nr:ABC transporter permease [Pseudoalteromonas ulvae]MBE0365858.1 putative ABC transport system permease protein [Pseudoalteromonas ulvae UL12]